MRSRAAAGAQVSVSLFPFLAVLICTMGVLLLLLVIAVHVADQTDAAHSASATAALNEALLEQQSNRELSTLKTEAVLASRRQLQAELEQARARRGHVEYEMSELEKRYADLQRQFREAAAPQALDAELLAADAARIAKEIEEANRLRTELQAQAQARPKMYSIVPHQSIHGTNRRPIYVECLPDSLVFRPGELAIPASELEPPTLPGNPLDVALQAVRTYWLNLKMQGEEGTPYPLLVVRPGGSRTYALARRAMQNWDDEFGYELIEADKELDFGEPDPALNAHLRNTLATARAQYAVLRESALAQQSRAAGGPSGEFGGGLQASPQGGFVVSGTRQPAGRLRAGGPANEGREGRSGTSRPGGENGWGRAAGDEASRDELQGRGSESAAPGEPGRSGSPVPNPRAAAAAGANSPGSLRTHQADSNQPGQNQLGSKQTGRKQSGQAGDSHSGSVQAGSQSGGSQGESGGTPSLLAGAAPASLAESRGANWAVPAFQPNATAYRRLVTIECTAEGLSLEPVVSGAARQTIRYETNLADTADQLVAELWDRIQGWGIAERNGYWLPELRFVVHEAGRSQFAQIRALLADSGLELQETPR